jgi:hypothetical protein
MFNDALPLFTRFLSFFHFWLPLFLIWLLTRLGYDRRAFWLWSPAAFVLVMVSYFLLPPPPAPPENPGLPVNVNYVFGLSDERPQEWMHPLLYLTGLQVILPLAVFWPSHMLLSKFFPSPDRASSRPPLSWADVGKYMMRRIRKFRTK